MEKLNTEALKSLASKYEDILEPQIRVLYMKIVNFIAVSQLPLVHVNTVLDLIKRDLLEQLKSGYFPEEK
jgi:hypothetical protein